MSADRPRLDDLRRRVEKDPASIAFAALAEELRRVAEYDDAVRVCRAGLEHHPTYLSARVTMARALVELRQFSEARGEFQYVLRAAPDNLLAQRGLYELDTRNDVPPSEPEMARAPTVAPPTPAPAPALEPAPVSEAQASAAPSSAADVATVASSVPEPLREADPPPPPDPVLSALEQWHAGIMGDRAMRRGR
jgi:tetratricopeptide (TPR) repeat protein